MLFSFLTALSWSLTGIFIAFAKGLNFIEITWIRVFLALLIFFPFSISNFDFSKKDIGLAALMSFYYISATAAFTLAPVSCVALLIATSPLFTVLIKIINKESVEKHMVIGSLIGFFGVAVFFSRYIVSEFSINYPIILGCFLSLLCSFLKSVYSYLVYKAESNKIATSNSLTLLTLIITSVLLLPFIELNIFFDLKTKTYISLILLAIVSTLMPTLFNSIASDRIDSTIHTSICLLTPIFSAFFAFSLLNEQLFMMQIFGAFVTLLGVLITNKLFGGKR